MRFEKILGIFLVVGCLASYVFTNMMAPEMQRVELVSESRTSEYSKAAFTLRAVYSSAEAKEKDKWYSCYYRNEDGKLENFLLPASKSTVYRTIDEDGQAYVNVEEYITGDVSYSLHLPRNAVIVENRPNM